MMRFVFVLAVFLLSFPIDEPRKKDTAAVQTEAEVYVGKFKSLTRGIVRPKKIDRFTIEFTDLDGFYIGYCYSKSHKIQVDRSFWDRATPYAKEELIFHELGHCACRLRHKYLSGDYDKTDKIPGTTKLRLIKGFFADGCPVTIMYPFAIKSECYLKHRAEYHRELQLRCALATVNPPEKSRY